MCALENIAMKEYVKAYLANGFIRHSRSEAVVPCMFVKRDGGKLRLVIDYRQLNAVTMKNRFSKNLHKNRFEECLSSGTG